MIDRVQKTIQIFRGTIPADFTLVHIFQQLMTIYVECFDLKPG